MTNTPVSGAALPQPAPTAASAPDAPGTPEDRTGDLLVRGGVVVFAVGAVATLITFAPLFLGTEPFPAVAYFVCMLMGLGFALAAAGLLKSAGAQRRQAGRSLSAASARTGKDAPAPASAATDGPAPEGPAATR